MTTKELINKQFEIEGIDYDFSQMTSSGLVETDKKKSKEWYWVHQFSSEQNYLKWKKLCLKHMDEQEFRNIDFKYGMTYKYDTSKNNSR